MSDFEVKTHLIESVDRHPNADRLDIIKLHGKDYICVVGRDQFKIGDVVAYIPEASVVPKTLLQTLGLEGRLAGKDFNRVKAVTLRGVLSQGLAYPMPDLSPGVDVQERLGIVKHVPVIPEDMAGEVDAAQKFVDFTVNNIMDYPNLFEDDAPCHITEKLHGTWCLMGRHGEEPVVTSLGLNGRGLKFKLNDYNMKKNMYVKQFLSHEADISRMDTIMSGDYYVLGEVFGQGVQDLGYGQTEKQFRVFDVWNGGKYLDFADVADLGWMTVPLLFTGEFDREFVNEITPGSSTIKHDQIREGVVVRSLHEKYDINYGTRHVLKSINPAYLMRRGGTEFT